MTSKAQWHFKPLIPGGTIREPIYGEFFSVDAISDPATSLIREAFQNSLDASENSAPVRIRIFLPGEDATLDTRDCPVITEGLWRHLHAKKNGVNQDSIPDSPFRMSYIVIEDFGTAGLTGDVTEPFRPRGDSENHFFHFFRAEGQTDKGSSSRGSWGIGKFVFYRSSRISSIFCYTVTAGSFDQYFMGKSILKSHYIKHEQDLCYQDGYLGYVDNDTEHLILPVQDPSFLTEIVSFFKLQRKTDQPGLSVIIPWPDPEIDSNAILMAVVKDYFFPILTGQLEVEIDGHEIGLQKLNKDSIGEIANDIPFTSDCKDLPHVIHFAEEIADASALQKYDLLKTESGTAWKWTDSLFPESMKEQMRLDYISGKPLAIKVSVIIREKGKELKDSYFYVYLKRSEADLPIRQVFIREGIIIPRVNGRKLRSTIGILYAEHEPITSFLRDSENPSHTEWQHGSTTFKGKYVSGRSDIEFVRQAITAICDFLASEEDDEDRELLAEYFPQHVEEVSDRKRRKPARKRGDKPDDPTIDVPEKTKLYFVNEVSNGFRIVGNPSETEETTPLFEISLKAAYEIREGNPVLRHSKFDFDFSSPDSTGLLIDSHGIEFLIIESNYIRFKVLETDFMLEVRGFDPKRDLYVRVRKIRE